VGGWFAAFLAGQLGGAIVVAAAGYELDGPDPPLRIQLLAQLPLWSMFVGIPLVIAARSPDGIAALGLRARLVDAWGVLGGLALQVSLIVVYLPIFELFDVDSDRLDDAARELTDRASGVTGAVLLILIAVVGAPLAEEVFYRGFFQPGVERALPGWAAIAVTSVVFAASHFQLLPFPGLLVFGVVAGILTYRTGRLGPAIALHIGFNLTTVIGQLAS
jgi:membrane protease YdiL (CAAX protease family)